MQFINLHLFFQDEGAKIALSLFHLGAKIALFIILQGAKK
jgi:hypothetical protein